MKKHGAGLSLEVIVVAALALVVMIVLILIFTGKIGPFVKETEDCSRMNGKCVLKEQCSLIAIAPQKCPNPDTEVCCVNQCLVQGGTCTSPCIDITETPEDECNGKCLASSDRIYTFGCDSGLICCKLKEVKPGG